MNVKDLINSTPAELVAAHSKAMVTIEAIWSTARR